MTGTGAQHGMLTHSLNVGLYSFFVNVIIMHKAVFVFSLLLWDKFLNVTLSAEEVCKVFTVLISSSKPVYTPMNKCKNTDLSGSVLH